jgi:FkbM family methyltransferase
MLLFQNTFSEWQKQFQLRKVPREGENRVHHFAFDGIELVIRDHCQSLAAQFIASEMKRNCYQLDKISFADKDVVIDIGAHVGIFDCYLAKRFPFLTIIAFEPVPRNFSNLLLNIRENRVTGIQSFNEAVSCTGKTVSLNVSSRNTGGASAFNVNSNDPHLFPVDVRSRTLDSIFKDFSISRCKLLKIDCEGAEYEILTCATVLERIEYLRGEFHKNGYLTKLGYSPEKLIDHCGKFMDRDKIAIEIFTDK